MAYVTQDKKDQLAARLAELGVRPEDLTETFILGSGKGGQKVNCTASCVRLVHAPSGIEIKCQRERSQLLNRFYARRELCERIEEKRDGAKSKKQQEREKVRRQKRRRSRRSKARSTEGKRRVADKKSTRGSVKEY
jgi:protein subunit release factor B